MKSPLVENASYIKDKSGYTDLQVLKSAAGWYIGTMFWNEEFGGFWEPGSRDSGYYSLEVQAWAALNEETWIQRMTP